MSGYNDNGKTFGRCECDATGCALCIHGGVEAVCDECIRGERDALRAEVAALKAGRWFGPWEHYKSLAPGEHMVRRHPRGHAAVEATDNAWYVVGVETGHATSLQDAMAMADTVALAHGRWLDGEPARQVTTIPCPTCGQTAPAGYFCAASGTGFDSRRADQQYGEAMSKRVEATVDWDGEKRFVLADDFDKQERVVIVPVAELEAMDRVVEAALGVEKMAGWEPGPAHRALFFALDLLGLARASTRPTRKDEP